jgi:prepilin-type N-terminal cleavage/methylation domain-containing protein
VIKLQERDLEIGICLALVICDLEFRLRAMLITKEFVMSRRSPTGFTLVEMLVVIGIIGILAALLLPAIMQAMNTTRNAAIAFEVNQLASAIEAYKQDKGDYPPNFRDLAVVTRHIRKCYPKIDPTYFTAFITKATPAAGSTVAIDEGESLVFWLTMTDNDPRYPFLSYFNPNNLTPSPKRYYDFDQTRLTSATADAVPSFKAKFCKDTYYIYIDSRSYDNPANDATDVCRFMSIDTAAGVDTYAYAEDSTVGVRPYWSSTTTGITTPNISRTKYKPINPTTFQLICAGQDGDFGSVFGQGGDSDVKIATGPLAGANFNVNKSDHDNITNFSNGKTLGDLIP